MRLGIYTDFVYRTDGGGLFTDRAFVLFLTALGERCDELVLFGRLDPTPGRAPPARARPPAGGSVGAATRPTRPGR